MNATTTNYTYINHAIITAYKAAGAQPPTIHIADEPFTFAALLTQHSDPLGPRPENTTDHSCNAEQSSLPRAFSHITTAAQRAIARITGSHNCGRNLTPDIAAIEREHFGAGRIHAAPDRIADLAMFTALARTSQATAIAQITHDLAPESPTSHFDEFFARFPRLVQATNWLPNPHFNRTPSKNPDSPTYALLASTASYKTRLAQPINLENINTPTDAFHILARHLHVLIPCEHCAIGLIAPTHETKLGVDFPSPKRGSWFMPTHDNLPAPSDPFTAPRATSEEIHYLRRALDELDWSSEHRNTVITRFHPTDVIRTARVRPTERARDVDFYRISLPKGNAICFLAVHPRCDEKDTLWLTLDEDVPDLAQARTHDVKHDL